MEEIYKEESLRELTELTKIADNLDESQSEIVLLRTGDFMRLDPNNAYYSHFNKQLFNLVGFAASGNIHILLPKAVTFNINDAPNGSTGLYYDLADVHIHPKAETSLSGILSAKSLISNSISYCLKSVLSNLEESQNLDFVVSNENIINYLAQALAVSLEVKNQEFCLHFLIAEINGLNEQIMYDPTHKKWELDHDDKAFLNLGENFKRYLKTKLYMLDFSYSVIVFILKYIIQYSQCLSASNNIFIENTQVAYFNTYFSSPKYNTIFSHRCSASERLKAVKVIETGIETVSAYSILKDYSLFIKETPGYASHDCKDVQSTFLTMFRMLIGNDNYQKFLVEELPYTYNLFRHSYHTQDPNLFVKMYVFMRDLYDFLVISNSGEYIAKVQSITSKRGYFFVINLPQRLVWYQIGIASIKLKYRCFAESI